MALNKLKDNRASSIGLYYSSVMDYNQALSDDGTDSETDKPQAKFKAFNDLIKLHHDTLNILLGYASSSSAYLTSDEGSYPSGIWWNNSDVKNTRTELFYSDSTYRDPLFYHLNTKNGPNKRHPYLWNNQYNSVLGSFDHFGYINSTSYSSTQNPFKTGENYRLSSPLEEYGNLNNLLWGTIFFDGKFGYRTKVCKDTDYTTHEYKGFNNYENSNGNPINNLIETWTDTVVPPSPFEIFRYTFWGTGDNTHSTSISITSHSASNNTGQFQDNAGFFSQNKWYAIYSSSDESKGWVIYVNNITGSGPYTVYYEKANWPTPITGDLNGIWDVNSGPIIPEDIKTGTTSNGLKNIWSSVYSQYYSSYFKSDVDSITSNVDSLISKMDDIINYDYTIISNVSGSEIGKSDTQAYRNNFNTWLTAWKSLVGDSGSGASYSTTDNKWSNTNLDKLFNDSNGGLDLLITLSSQDYSSTQSGYIPDWKNKEYSDILGTYSLGSSEVWDPDITNFNNNNSGDFTPGKLYQYRYDFAYSRLNRTDGILVKAYNAKNTADNKLVEISNFESDMVAKYNVTNNKYDITPNNTTGTTDEEDKVEITWDDVKSASSYSIDRKEGLNGVWTSLESQYGYVDPGDPPDFSSAPSSTFTQQAYTNGYQEFGLNFSSPDDNTGLSDDFTVYDFLISVDNGTNQTVNIKGLDCKTYNALAETINKYFTNNNIKASCNIVNNDIRVISSKKGDNSKIVLNSGITNDLFTALATTPDTSVDGTTYLEQGKVYYYRVKVNNGYNSTLGGGTKNDKDWNSQSELDLENLNNDRSTHGTAAMITWDPPEEIKASGIDEGITPSENYIRIEWLDVINADHYAIYRSTSEDGSFAKIGTSYNNYYEDTSAIPGFIYYYKVKAIADSNQKLFDENGNLLDEPISTSLPAAGVRGKRLWQTITLNATTDNKDTILLTWNSLAGATHYRVYFAMNENGPFMPVLDLDGSNLLITDTQLDFRFPAIQFSHNTYTDINDGISDGDYDPNERYYFTVVNIQENGEPSIVTYYADSPSSGTWKIQDISNQIEDQVQNKYDDIVCEFHEFKNMNNFRLLFKTKALAEKANIKVIPPLTGKSLLSLLGGMETPKSGHGAFPLVNMYFKVEGVEVISNEIVRVSEKSNVAKGYRTAQ